jgi:gliding motility-associated-like protein
VNITNGCDEDFLMPNAFTPNSDGLNDVFLPIIVKTVTDYDLRIFSRWGIMIFESDNPSVGWDGFDRGVKGEMGVYVWMLDYTLEDGTRKNESGNVSLLR